MAGRHGHCGFHQPAGLRLVRRASCDACWIWASIASRPISASASRPTSSGTTAPTRSRCTTTTRYLYNKTVFDAAAGRTAARARRWCSPAPPPSAAQQFPVHWGGDCYADVRVDGRKPARRAVARPVRLRLLEPRHRRVREHRAARTCTSAGARSACCRPTAACTAAAPTGCRGCYDEEAVRCAAPLHAAQMPPDAVSLPCVGAGQPAGHAGDARDAAGVPGRPGVRLSGPAVHAGR